LALALCLLPAAAFAAAPAIEYSTPDPIRNTEATLRFSVDPEGLETSYEVEIAKVGQSLNSWGMPRLAPTGEDPVALEVDVPRYFEGGLIPGTQYHWRVTAWNDDGKTVGTEQLFTTTDGPMPTFATAGGSQTGSGQVSFTGTVDPEGAALTGCRFRWVDKTIFTNAGFEKWAATEMVRFGETVPCDENAKEIGSGTEPVPVSGLATDLEPGEYVFRVEGENAFGGPVSGKGVPFTVSTDFGGSGPSGPQSLGPSLSLPTSSVGLPRKACRKTRNAKKAVKTGKKRTHQKSSRRGKACGRR
jgi:hypothetical protein